MNKEQLKAATAYAGKTFAEVAEALGVSRQNFTQRANRASWTGADLERIAQALGAEYFEGFRFPNGKEI